MEHPTVEQLQAELAKSEARYESLFGQFCELDTAYRDLCVENGRWGRRIKTLEARLETIRNIAR